MRFGIAGLAAAALLASAAPANAAWYEARSKHFIIYADESPRTLQAFSTKLEKFDKAVRIVRNMDDPPLGDAGRVTIFVLPDSDSVSLLVSGKRGQVAGFYIPRASGSVAFVPQKSDGNEDWDLHADTVFFHEYAHHLQLQNTDASLPMWLTEGFAEFFAAAAFPNDESVQLGLAANHRAGALYLDQQTPIEVLLGEGPKNATVEQMDSFYGRAWLLTHYLTDDESRRGQLAKYVAAISRGADLLSAAQEAFGDLKQLDRDLDRYRDINRFQSLNVKSPEFSTIAVALRPLGAGEAAIMPVRIRSARGVDDKTAAEVAGLARTAAAPYPNDPAVQTALAEAEFDARNYRAADDAADRALRSDPKSVKALVYKGRAEMELAKTPADWERIRGYFLAANRIDTEDPEPLLQYYETFARSGQRPTKNAIDGLMYALVLAPQDPSLRFTAVVQLINDKQFSEARTDLGPIAFNPHSSDDREKARKLIDALGKNDSGAVEQALAAFANN